MHRVKLWLVGVLPGVALAAPLPVPITYNNETNTAAEADYAAVTFPSMQVVSPSVVTAPIFGQLFKSGLTDPFGPAATVSADVGYGAFGSDLRTTTWSWFSATYNAQLGNNDEYVGALVAPAVPGVYSYTYRFTLNAAGAVYTLADLNGAGSNVGLTFETTQLGTLVVPEPAALGAFAFTGTLLTRRRR